MNSRIPIPVSGDAVSEFDPTKDAITISIVPSNRAPDEPKWRVHIGRTILKNAGAMHFSYLQSWRSMEAAFKDRNARGRGFVLMLNGEARHVVTPKSWDFPEQYNISFDSDIIDPFPIATKEQVIRYNNFDRTSIGGSTYPVSNYVAHSARTIMSSVLGNEFIQIGGFDFPNNGYYGVLGIPIDRLALDEYTKEMCLKIYGASYKFNSATKTCWVEKQFDNGAKDYYVGDGGANRLKFFNILSLERKQ
jgi:hypothetical protein